MTNVTNTTNLEPGQVWEVHVNDENRWIRAIVTKVDGGGVTFRYEGILEFVRVSVDEVQNKPERFRSMTDSG
jgi:hypothetical protein